MSPDNIDLESKQKELEKILANKVQELRGVENTRNEIDNTRNQLTTEIVKLQGKLEMLKEINSDKPFEKIEK